MRRRAGAGRQQRPPAAGQVGSARGRRRGGTRSGGGAALSGSRLAGGTAGLTVVTWNLNGLEDRHLDARTEAACLHLLLRDDPPDIVALQEVVDRTWHAHLLPHFGHAGYAALPGRGESGYWCALFIRQPLQVLTGGLSPLPGSQQGRTLLEAEVDWGARRLWVATAHLESLRGGAGPRKAQLHHVFDRLADQGRGIFAGDTNLREAEVAEVRAAREACPIDAWEAVGSRSDRVTWKAGRRGMRLDRVYLQGLLPRRVRRLGAVEVEEAGGERPSDHLAVEVEVEVDR